MSDMVQNRTSQKVNMKRNRNGYSLCERVLIIMGRAVSVKRTIVFFVGCAMLVAAAQECPGFVCERTEKGVRLVRGGRVMWNLDVDTPEGKPALHPLTLPSGRVFTDFHPADH